MPLTVSSWPKREWEREKKRTRNWLKLVFQEQRQRQQWNNVFIWRCILQLGLSKIANAVNEGERTSSRGGRKNEVADPFVSFFLFSLSLTLEETTTHTHTTCVLPSFLPFTQEKRDMMDYFYFVLPFFLKEKEEYLYLHTESEGGERASESCLEKKKKWSSIFSDIIPTQQSTITPGTCLSPARSPSLIEPFHREPTDVAWPDLYLYVHTSSLFTYSTERERERENDAEKGIRRRGAAKFVMIWLTLLNCF